MDAESAEFCKEKCVDTGRCEGTTSTTERCKYMTRAITKLESKPNAKQNWYDDKCLQCEHEGSLTTRRPIQPKFVQGQCEELMSKMSHTACKKVCQKSCAVQMADEVGYRKAETMGYRDCYLSDDYDE